MTDNLLKSFFILPFLTILVSNACAQVKTEKAAFAGGCFWCMTPSFEKLDGVLKVISGYTGGSGKNPDYQDYAAKGHIEAVEITYAPDKISYSELLDVFWRQINPTDAGGQFCDRGPQYRSAIFYHNEEQKRLAEKSKENLGKSGKFNAPIVTELIPAADFYPAEDYHQDYHRKNPLRYKFYRFSCGRDQYLEKVWGRQTEGNSPARNTGKYIKPGREELKQRLTAMQYKVTRENATEPAFHNEYWDNHREGLYVDVVSGEVLFSSLDKFDSGTGWPSFSKPLEPDNLVEKQDKSFFMTRTEVRSKRADSHLGHIFNDGPAPKGLRYCLNSAALRFVPREDLDQEGYGQYRKLFEK